MTGWISSAGSGPVVSMRSSATSTAWTSRHQRKRRQGENDERPLVGPPDRARPALPRGGVIQGVQVRPAREPHARALARRMARARRARDGGRGPAGRPGRRPLDAGADPARRRRARAGNPGPRRAVRALFAQTRRYQPDGLGGRDGAAVGLRGLRPVRVGGQDDRSPAVHTGSGQRGAGTQGRREVDAHSRQRTASRAGEGLAGAYRPGAAARVGALRRRWEPGDGWNQGEAHHGRSAHAARHRNNGDASRRSHGARVQLGWLRYAVATRSRWWRHAADVVDQHRSPLHRDGCCRVAPLLRCSGSPAQWDPPRPHRWSRGDEVRWLATTARGVRKAVRRILNFYDANMTKSGASQGQSAAELISKRIAELGDWRGETLSRMRKLIKQADRDVVEEWKWVKPKSPGTPVWSHDGIICTGESYKNAVKLTFAQGAFLKDPARLFNSSLDGNVRRAIDIHEGEEIDASAFKALVRQAVALNSSVRSKPSKKAK